MQEAMLLAPWPDKLLQHTKFAAQMAESGEPLFRGPRWGTGVCGWYLSVGNLIRGLMPCSPEGPSQQSAPLLASPAMAPFLVTMCV